MTQLHIDISECRHLADIAEEAFDAWGGPALSIRPLRSLPDGRLRSGVLALPKGREAAMSSGDADIVQGFVMSGSISIDGKTLDRHGFFVAGSGHIAHIAASENSQLILIFDRLPTDSPPFDRELLVIEDAFSIEPFTPIIGGKLLEGFERRVLWLDPVTGADTRLLRVPAGFRGGGPNWHPVEEEIFCLEGDIAPDETRPMRSGSYLWNPANSIHGFNEFTEGGCLLLEWHDGPWSLTPSPDSVRPDRA